MSLARERERSRPSARQIPKPFPSFLVTILLPGHYGERCRLLIFYQSVLRQRQATFRHCCTSRLLMDLFASATSFTFTAQEKFSNSLLMRIKSLVSDVVCRCRIARLMAKKLPVRRRVLWCQSWPFPIFISSTQREREREREIGKASSGAAKMKVPVQSKSQVSPSFGGVTQYLSLPIKKRRKCHPFNYFFWPEKRMKRKQKTFWSFALWIDPPDRDRLLVAYVIRLEKETNEDKKDRFPLLPANGSIPATIRVYTETRHYTHRHTTSGWPLMGGTPNDCQNAKDFVREIKDFFSFFFFFLFSIDIQRQAKRRRRQKGNVKLTRGRKKKMISDWKKKNLLSARGKSSGAHRVTLRHATKSTTSFIIPFLIFFSLLFPQRARHSPNCAWRPIWPRLSIREIFGS